jgi:hypothetical protein
MSDERRFPNGSVAEFDALIACYRSGQMSERQWQEHRNDKAFAAYLDQLNRPQDSVELKPVIVRTNCVGAHFGFLKRRDGREVELERSRRLWYSNGPWTLSEIATAGIDNREIRIDAPVSIVLTEALEIIDCTPQAARSIEAASSAESKP